MPLITVLLEPPCPRVRIPHTHCSLWFVLKPSTAAHPLALRDGPSGKRGLCPGMVLRLFAFRPESYVHPSLGGHTGGSVASHRSSEEPKGWSKPSSLPFATAKFVC